MALPVVDNEDRLVGIVTYDDAIDVIVEESDEDAQVMAAITPSAKPYLKTGIFEIWMNRIPWLLLMMLSATFTGMIITGFESALAAQVTLTAFIPMLMSTGGNTGSQSSTTVIRGLSMGEVEFSDVLRVIWKEIRVGALCAITLAGANFLKIWLFDILILRTEGLTLAVNAVVCITLALTVITAKLVGCTLPILAKKIKLDPAVMAAPFITTILDAVSLLIYFALATAILGL
jgi:magnesium transporter